VTKSEQDTQEVTLTCGFVGGQIAQQISTATAPKLASYFVPNHELWAKLPASIAARNYNLLQERLESTYPDIA
jgi:hypothetical protein